jgi:hypothetical protein
MPNEAIVGPSMQESVNPEFLISFQSLNPSIRNFSIRFNSYTLLPLLLPLLLPFLLPLLVAASGCRFAVPNRSVLRY